MKRAGALLGVVVMVTVAFLVRNVLDTDDTADGSSPSRSGPSVLCPTELADVCEASDVEVSTESAGSTADRLLAASDTDALDADAWIVPAAWARLVIDERARLGRAPLFEIADEPLASSGVVLTIWADRNDELATTCGGDVGWRCLAEQEGATLATGDRVRPAGPLADSAGGLTLAAGQMAELVGRADFAANDFDGTVRSLADRLARGQMSDPLRTMRSRGPGQITAAGVLLADARNLSSTFGAIVPIAEGGPRADLVVLVRRGADLDGGLRADLAAAFVAAGWDPPADGSDGLPDGSVLAAVRTLWNQSR